MKNGDDRAGRERTWPEVAAVFDLSVGYVRGLATGTYKMPQDVPVYDPRDVQPELRDILSDADVAAWQANPLCLCGCGAEVKRESSRVARAPHGGWRMFVGSHVHRMPWVRDHLARHSADPVSRQKVKDTKAAMTIDARVLAEDIREWKVLTGETYKELAQRCHINVSHISSIVHGRIPRVSRLTAGKLLVGMGQSVRPEIAQAYRAWHEDWQLPMPPIRVES